jgi:hypothetical protein
MGVHFDKLSASRELKVRHDYKEYHLLLAFSNDGYFRILFSICYQLTLFPKIFAEIFDDRFMVTCPV